MRILYLADSFRPSRSACANRAAVLVDALRGAGHDVRVLASSDSLLSASGSYEKPEYVTFFKTFPLEKKTLINRLRNNFGGSRESVRIADGMGDFDVVVCTTPPLLLTSSAVKIAKRKRAKLVLDVRDIWPDVAYEMGSFAPGSLYGRFFERLARKAYRAADLIISVSPGKIAKLRKRVPAKPVKLVPNGIDEAFANLQEDPSVIERYGLLSDLPICSYVGNIGLAQGIGTLLDIAEERKDVRFLIFGKGAEEANLRKRALSRKLENVEFCGTVEAVGVFTVLRHSTFTYIPLVSSKMGDSIPTKTYEALACGCPVLMVASGDAADLVEESSLGLHAPPENQEAILEAFDVLSRNPYSSEDRDNARAWVIKKHSRQEYARGFVEGINEMGLKRRRNGQDG